MTDEPQGVKPGEPIPEQVLISELGLLLSEQSAYQSIVRTGLAILVLPVTLTGFLLATAELHKLFHTVWIGTTTGFVLLAISVIGLVIAMSAKQKADQVNDLIARIKTENKRLAEILV